MLALNILHHFIKTEEAHAQLVDLLKRLDSRFIVFGAHDPGEPQMRTAYRNYSPEEFVAFLLGHTGLKKSARIGTTHDDRNIFLLSA